MEVSIDYDAIEREIVIFVFLGIINKKDIVEKINNKVELCKNLALKINKDKKFRNSLIKNKIKFLEKKILEEVVILENTEYPKEYYDKIINNKKEVYEIDNGIAELFENYNIVISREQYIKSYLKYESSKIETEEIKIEPNPIKECTEIVPLKKQTVLEDTTCTNNNFCECCKKNTIQLTEKISCSIFKNNYRELLYKIDSDYIYGMTINNTTKTIFKGYFLPNGDYRFGNYSYRSNCDCCDRIEIIGDLKYNKEKDTHVTDGYCEIRHYDKQNKIVKIESGEYSEHKLVENFGSVYDNCSKCGINENNILCGVCGYMCIDCHTKIHLKLNKQNKIMSHNNVFYLDYENLSEDSRIKIGIRDFIIKEKGQLFKCSYNKKLKNIDYKNKKKFAPKTISSKEEDIGIKMDKVFELVGEYTNDFKMGINDSRMIIKSDIFKTRLDTLLQ